VSRIVLTVSLPDGPADERGEFASVEGDFDPADLAPILVAGVASAVFTQTLIETRLAYPLMGEEMQEKIARLQTQSALAHEIAHLV